jgi:soluble lytic murein transglycosylase-like protein
VTLPGAAMALDLGNTAWETAGARQRLDPVLLYAIGIVESGRDQADGIAPHPYAFNFQGRGSRFARDEREAQAILASRQDQGRVDVGAMQISLRHHRHRVSRPEDLLDLTTNIEVAAAILREAIDSAPGDLILGVGRYHSYRDDRARAYGELAFAIYRNLIALQLKD